MTETEQTIAPIIIEATVQELKCPHLDIIDDEVLCRATDWGRINKDAWGAMKQNYGVLPHAIIIHCSGIKHLTCSTYKKQKILVQWSGKDPSREE